MQKFLYCSHHLLFLLGANVSSPPFDEPDHQAHLDHKQDDIEQGQDQQQDEDVQKD